VKKSAGLLLYRVKEGLLEVLLVHPGGPFWRNRDEGAWSIPKGEIGEDEDPFHAARREFEEETGGTAPAEAVALEPIRQQRGKLVFAWAARGDFDPATLRSNLFSMEWPPGSGHTAEFPEADEAAWFPLDVARRKILKGQLGFLDQLETRLR
jgi:predicted NUDIX family NTP pyrophosphohydrolase